MSCNFFLFAILWLLKTTSPAPTVSIGYETTTAGLHPDRCRMVVIAHRGASGYVPEHTLGAYALAVTMGADYIEPDLVMTSDGHLVARHEIELSITTDVSLHPEFASRNRSQFVNGIKKTGWFTEDFTLAELKTLRVVERIPKIRPGNAKMDGSFLIPTFKEIIDLVKSLQLTPRRVIGIYPEIKHSTHFKRLQLPMERAVVETLQKNGYSKRTDPIYIQSLEVTNLKELKNYTEMRLLQLYAKKYVQPYDQVVLGTNLTYGDMATEEGLRDVAQYAAAVGPDKSYIIPRNANNRLCAETTFVADAHRVGLKVQPYTFRAENYFLPEEYQSVDKTPTAFGDFSGELRRYFATGIDGVFSDHPDISVRVRGSC